MRGNRSSAVLATALVLLLISASISQEHWPLLACLGVLAWIGHAIIGTPAGRLWRRWLGFLPFILVIAISTTATGLTPDTLVWTGVLVLRCTVALLIGLWLMESLSGAALLDVLQRWHTPPVLVATSSVLLRYLSVFWEEAERMRRAQESRAGGPPTPWARWTAAVQRLGALVLRALDRAERSHRALVARGWDGVVRTLDSSP